MAADINVKAGRFSGPPPEELPRLYTLVAFVPRIPEGDDWRMVPDLPVAGDDWRWLRREMPGGPRTIDQVPEALIYWNSKISADPEYGKPHFRLVEVTGEGMPVSPAPAILFREEEGCDCRNAEETAGSD